MLISMDQYQPSYIDSSGLIFASVDSFGPILASFGSYRPMVAIGINIGQYQSV